MNDEEGNRRNGQKEDHDVKKKSCKNEGTGRGHRSLNATADLQDSDVVDRHLFEDLEWMTQLTRQGGKNAVEDGFHRELGTGLSTLPQVVSAPVASHSQTARSLESDSLWVCQSEQEESVAASKETLRRPTGKVANGKAAGVGKYEDTSTGIQVKRRGRRTSEEVEAEKQEKKRAKEAKERAREELKMLKLKVRRS
jgi:hypothetical protein